MAKKEVKDVVKKDANNEKSIKDKTTKKDIKSTIKKENTVSKFSNKAEKKTPKISISKSNTTVKTSNKSSTPTLKTKISSKKTSSRTKSINESTAKSMLAEYYDLPYRYNQTIVKILAQTPTTLFVYWDISDDDRNSLISTHGENFFYETKPILIVHNLTKDYSFEIEINDFANSWYIRTQEPNSDYVIELGRRFHNKNNEYVYIHSSNDIVSPNDHILFENTNLGNVVFKNVKTNKLSSKDFGSLRFINDIDKLYGNIYDVYSTLYDDKTLNELTGPSSGEFYLNR